MTALANYIKKEQTSALKLLETWININSWSKNPEGIALMRQALIDAFSFLGKPQRVQGAIHWSIYPENPLRILLGGHFDTVYPPEKHRFAYVDQDRLIGPGAADMKGGIAVIWLALRALHAHNQIKPLGIELLLTEDEELGSPTTSMLWQQLARVTHYALLFEPSLPDGAIVSHRPSSCTGHILVKGKAAHIGRDPSLGRSASAALVQLLSRFEELVHAQGSALMNIGELEAKGPVNVVQDYAFCRLNIRSDTQREMDLLLKELTWLAKQVSDQREVAICWEQETYRPAKFFDQKSKDFFDKMNRYATPLGFTLHYRPAKGVCDGNWVAYAGVATLDTMGVIGAHTHTENEYMEIDSLSVRATLLAEALSDALRR